MPITAISRDSPRASPPLQPASYEEALAIAEPGDTIATTKEEEWVTRKKSEVTTTRQIATRVKRELVLEDGKILKDSGPKISTSVNEDTHTTNFQQTEHRVPDEANGDDDNDAALNDQVGGAIGAPLVDEVDGPRSVVGGELAPAGGKVLVSSRVVANLDGKVRESKDLKVLTRNVTERVKETEERFHRGDTTHDALITAVNETREDDIRDALKVQTEHQLALVPRGPRVVKDTVAHKTTIDTDDTEELRALRPDGTIVTERRHTKQQEAVGDQELPEEEAHSLPSDRSVVSEKGGTEKRTRVEHEHTTDLMAGGRRIASHLQSRTRTEEAEREGQPNMDDNWDSLSVRMRRQRRLRQPDHEKDYAKRPLDFDIEEETRKKETSKWLESHFGSDSRSSHDSIAEEIGRRPEPGYYVKTKTADDEGYYGKTSSSIPPPPIYADRALRKTKSSTPSDERAAVNRTGGYFKGVADWSQRRASKPRMPEPRSSSPSPPAVRSPYGSNDRLNGSSPRHVYGKRDSPQGRSSPIGRRHPPSRDDSAYVSSSTMHSPPRGSPFRPLEADRSFREPSVEDDYRPPIAPERKRHTKARLSEEHRYDSGYRSSSRNENSGRSRDSRDEGAAEPPPDYSPPRERRESSDRDRTPPPRRRDERKQHQKTRFATESARRPSPARKSVGQTIGNSIRKLVGKIRSASAERRARWRTSRSPSPAEHSSRTYRQYGGELAPPNAPTHRYYLGEDPFAPSIYGREHKYEGSSRRAAAPDTRDHRDRGQLSSTLGRFSHSTSRLNPNSEAEEDYSRSAQTLPRKLHDRKEKTTEKPSSNKYWHKLTPSKRSSSAVNVAHHVSSSPNGDVKVNGYPPGPAKPARSYKALNRSKSFAMGAPESETHPRYVSGMSRNYSTMYKSNPHLSRLDETPEQLKSPGIVSIINRSQRDLADAVSRETERRRDGLFGARYGKTTPVTNGHTNGYSKYDETDKKKMFLKGLRERAPELYHTLHADDESDGSRLSSRYGSPSPAYKERSSEERKTLYKTESLNRENSPFVSRLETRLKSPTIRRGSNSSDNYSETYRYTTRSGDPERPSVTDTVETVCKKVVPMRDGRGKEIIESREVNSVTKSRGYKEPLTNLKYIENGSRSSPLGFEARNGSSPLYTERRSSNYKVLEKVRDY